MPNQAIKVCKRCKAQSKTAKRRCKLRTCFSYPYCYIHNPAMTGLTVKTSNIPGAGKGLFAAKQFTRCNYLIDYTGETLTKAMLDRRYGKGQADYALQVGKDLFIDAPRTDQGLGRLINTADYPRGTKRRFKNNVRFVIDTKKHTARMQACTKIQPGDEIFGSYNDEYRLGGKKTTVERSLCRAAFDVTGRCKPSGKSGESRARRAKRLAREAAAAAAAAKKQKQKKHSSR